ncbi:hypothetical protein KCU64_g70, partial [Aureobasidium melanogenum]
MFVYHRFACMAMSLVALPRFVIAVSVITNCHPRVAICAYRDRRLDGVILDSGLDFSRVEILHSRGDARGVLAACQRHHGLKRLMAASSTFDLGISSRIRTPQALLSRRLFLRKAAKRYLRVSHESQRAFV